MKIRICDICGKPIKKSELSSKYKLKKEVRSWNSSWWENLDVHNSCWEWLCYGIEVSRQRSFEKKDKVDNEETIDL